LKHLSHLEKFKRKETISPFIWHVMHSYYKSEHMK